MKVTAQLRVLNGPSSSLVPDDDPSYDGAVAASLSELSAALRAAAMVIDRASGRLDPKKQETARPSRPTKPVRLTPRERQVLGWIGLGYSTKGTAYELGISASTVRVLLVRAARKVGASNRPELMAAWQELSSGDGATDATASPAMWSTKSIE